MRLYHMLEIVFVTLTSTLFFAQTVSVTPQQGSPVTITSVRVSDSVPGDPEWSVTVNALNSSGKPIEAIGLKANRTRNSTSGSTTGVLIMPSVVKGKRQIQPNQVFEEELRFGASSNDSSGDQVSVSVDYVLFADDTRWGSDSLKFSDSVHQMRAGAKMYKLELEQGKTASPK